MKEDVHNKPVEVTIGTKTYLLEYDNNAYIQTEYDLGMGLCKILDTIVKDNNLKYEELFEIFCIGLMKHHSKAEIIEARELAKNDMSSLMLNSYLVQAAFVTQLLLPKVAHETEKKTPVKKKMQKSKTKK